MRIWQTTENNGLKMKMNELMENKKQPDGTYAAVKFDDETNKMLVEFCNQNNIPNQLNDNDFHCTVTYSRKYLPDYEPLTTIDPAWNATPDHFEVWESGPNAYKDDTTHCLVLKLQSPELHERFKYAMDDLGATYDYDEYKPHVTLSYDVGEDFDHESLPLPGNISIVSEYTEDLDLGA